MNFSKNSPVHDLPASTGDMLSKLLDQWHHLHGRRARGGWWALSGFSFQTGLYLLRFFRGLQEGHTEPGRLAEMEILSDVVFPQDGQLTLIQAKRTLEKGSLVAALEEMYLLTDLCQKETPTLLPYLRFQIACRTKSTPLQPATVSRLEVIPEGGDDLWNLMLERFDESNPIVIEPDSLDQLHVVLWNIGVLDTTALIEKCAGRMLRSFENPSLLGVRELGRDLAHLLRASPRRDHWQPIGHLLKVEDVAPEDDVTRYTGVLAGQTPKLEHLRKGFFRTRPAVDEELTESFEQWLRTVSSSHTESSGKVPVFWIGGRSGEGKSVLLLQLASRFVCSINAQPTLLLRSATDVVSLMEAVPNRLPHLEADVHFLHAVVDDLYDVQDRDAWDEMIHNACAIRTPQVAIITCGPTEQLEQFKSRLADQFDISAFLIPPLRQQEYEEFVEWFEKRTGTNRDRTLLTDENALLVQLIFELAQGMKMPEFAKRFRKRLRQAKLFEAARSILAVNSLYLDAPIGLVDTDEGRDALDRLCLQDQLHFRITDVGRSPTERGVRLAHAHLAWLIFKEWIEPPTTLAKGWARELEQALAEIERTGTHQWASNLITAFVQTPHLSDKTSVDAEGLPHLRADALEELYRKHVSRHGGAPSVSTLAQWIKLQFQRPEFQFEPDPVDCALVAFRIPSLARRVHGFVAFWVVQIAERLEVRAANRARAQVEEFLRHFPNNPSMGFAVAQIYSHSRNREWATRLAREWLGNAPANPEAYQLLAFQVAASAGDAGIRAEALRWLNANPQNPQAYQILVQLVAANSGDNRVREEVLDWLDTNPQHPQAYSVLTALVAANAGDGGVRKEALAWLRANPLHPRDYHVLATLVAANVRDTGVREAALSWLGANPQHPQAYWLLATLVAANQEDQKVRGEALHWLNANADHPQSHQLLSALLAANAGDEGVREKALSWLKASFQHPRAYHVLAALVAANSGDSEVRAEALGWLAANPQHPQAYQVLAPLIVADAGDEGLRAQALRWIDANPQHPQAYWLLAPLVATSTQDDGACEEALGWLKANPHHPNAYQLLAPLVAATEGNDRVRDEAFGWLHANPHHPKAYQLLAPLVAATDGNDRVRDEALGWLYANPQHPQAYVLLKTVIARLPNKDQLLELGERYVMLPGSSHPEEIAGVLLTAGNARPKYITLALDLIERSPKYRNPLLYHLSRALSRHPENCIEYLNDAFDEHRKGVVCRSLAIGLGRMPDAIVPFLDAASERLAQQYVSLVFQYAISLDIASDDLAVAVGRWLTQNYRRSGYGRLIGALRRNPRYWGRIHALMLIRDEVCRDFSG